MLRSIYRTDYNTIAGDFALLILRIISGSFMLTHGWGKLIKVVNGPPYEFADPIGIGEPLSLILTAFAEGICAILVIMGFGVRITTVPIMIAMLVAAFVAHNGEPFSSKEMPLMYFTMFLVIAIMGAGRISIDRLLEKKKT